MTEQEKELLLKDLCARLQYGFKYQVQYGDTSVRDVKKFILDGEYSLFDTWMVHEIKPYLRPMSSMTEEEAKEIATLHDLKKILSVKITNEYIDVIIDDEFSSTERITLWYDELVSSIECFDLLNEHHFDYRGLIEKGLALPAKENMYND